jgi:allose kinase
MGFPSIVSRDGRTIVQTPNVVGLDRVPMADLARERFGFPVFVQKDVNLLLRHDIGALGLEDADPVLGFYVGTGFGNSIRIGGTFFAGANGAAGELGHIPLTGNAEVCSCGNKGCAETIAAGKSLAARMASRHPGLSIGDCFVECGDDPWIDEFVDLVSFPIAIEMNILDPEAVILGGGVVNMRGFPLERLVDAVRAKLRAPYPRESVRILHAEESTLSGVIGAIGYALDAL